MAAGDIIFEDGTIVTPNDMEKLMPALVALISSTQKDVGQYEEVKSLQGVSSLPVFQQAGNVYKLVRVAVELLKGVDGREIYLQVNADRTYIQWRWTDGVWQNLYKIEDLRGEPVVLRTGSQGIEWKYRDEADTAWRMLVTYEVLKLKYSDLTPEQVEDLWRHLPADVLAQFQKPATDAATEVRKKMDGITEEANTLMDDVRELESSVSTAESGRVNAEKGRVDAESARRVAEVNRENSEDERETAETGRANAESTRVSNENARKTAETGRVNAENTRVSQENARKTAETGRVDAEKARVTAENNRVTEFATLKQNAETATANANDTANHPTYIGEDHYVYKWNKATKAYDKTDIYVKGDAFSIKKVYASVAALQADVNNADIKVGDFVLVNTNNVEDPDNAKLYVKVQNTNGSYAYDFLVDMSGAIGFTGKTPQFSIGTVSSGVTPAVTLSENGVDSNGNPRYKLNLVLPKGEKGEAPVLQIGTITTGTPGGSASASITANGSTSEGAPIFKLNMTIPQGPQGKGNVSVTESGLVSGKTYLFKPSANNSATGTLVDADGKYLKLTGGTMTDRIHFKTNVADSRFFDFIKPSTEEGASDEYLGSIGLNDTALTLYNAKSTNKLELFNTGEIKYGNQKVWHAGNDGSGSGLDADTVDGKHSSGFINYINTINADGYPKNEMGYGYKSVGWIVDGGPVISIGDHMGDGKSVWQMQADTQNNKIWSRFVRANVASAWKEFAFLDANGKVAKAIIADSATNADTVDNFHAIGPATNNLIRRGSVRSETDGLSSYWCKFASVNISEANGDRDLVLYVSNVYASNSTATGILKAHVRIGTNTPPVSIVTTQLTWLVNKGIDKDAFKLYYDDKGNFELWCSLSYTGAAGKYNSFQFAVISEGTRTNNIGTYWTLYNTVFTTVQTPTLSNSITSILLTLENPTLQAKSLLTARTINGVAFDGTANITITAAANGGNSATVGGYSNSAILVTRAAPVNIDSTDSTWNSTYNPSSGGTKPTIGYGLVTQFNNIQGGVPGNGGVYVSQLGFDAGGSVFYRNRYDTTAWSTWKQFIFNDDSRLTNARPADGGTSAACSGNAATATKLQTARKINGVDFDGHSDISVPGLDLDRKPATDSPSTYPMGLTMSRIYTNGYPVNYGNALTMRGLGDTQIITEWPAAQEAAGDDVMLNMFVRGRRDNLSDWSGFRRVITEGCDFSGRNIRLSGDIVSAGYVYTETGWFQNNRADVGLYNQATDTRWYSRSSDSGKWYADKGAYFEGTVWSHGFFKASDIRLKSDVKPLSHTLEQILSIPTSSFIMNGNRQIGSIAQEIEPDFPEIVSNIIKRKTEVPEADDWDTFTTEENGEIVEYAKVKTVEYEMLSVLALEGLKLLNQKVDNLKKQLNVK